ncbi:type I-C CRISPR-associated protein Cas5c [Chondromyces apiculatus]|uniref:pre-crRNA processing endonuclease n=1 Tax=Chondromyces apiculatus DSM 436 TaxID=1192034 RepID=A0A017T7V1_9BACT|nr:type I-C CRISPR-associated protein Cas5c [Chondromyces apiculatus]EYF05348.1 CRISPR-associated protein, CT1134 family [Chondromyces apiculatus DSM 436]
MHSNRFQIRAFGPTACFTRPEMKVERVSYEVMTPSAARGLVEAILWKPAIRWHIHEIAVLRPIRWVSFRRNEVNDRASPRVLDFFADEPSRRAQRNTVALRDVDYVITASFAMTERAGPDDNVTKFEQMFARRLERGQCFHAPCLGCREFAASVEPAPPDLQPIEPTVDRPLGMMFYDFDYRPGRATRPLFFEARLSGGVLRVPSWAEVLRENAAGGAA